MQEMLAEHLLWVRVHPPEKKHVHDVLQSKISALQEAQTGPWLDLEESLFPLPGGESSLNVI